MATVSLVLSVLALAVSAIALWQSRWVCASGLPRGVVLMDAGYGAEPICVPTSRTHVAGIRPKRR